MLTKVSYQSSITYAIDKHLSFSNAYDHLFLVKKEEGIRSLEAFYCTILLSDYIVESERLLYRFDKQVFIELFEELHIVQVAFIGNIL